MPIGETDGTLSKRFTGDAYLRSEGFDNFHVPALGCPREGNRDAKSVGECQLFVLGIKAMEVVIEGVGTIVDAFFNDVPAITRGVHDNILRVLLQPTVEHAF